MMSRAKSSSLCCPGTRDIMGIGRGSPWKFFVYFKVLVVMGTNVYLVCSSIRRCSVCMFLKILW